jgi:tetratricopeptide (TPR) repeat protein
MAAALYFHFKYNKEFDEVSYARMLTLLPFGVDAHRVEMGNYHIEKGLAELKEGNYRDSLRLLRIGVARAPANLEGRRVLAEFYEFALKRHDIAIDQLLQGIEQGGHEDLDYLKQTLRLLLRYQKDEDIQNLANTYLPEEPDLTEINQTLAFGAAHANHLRGNYDRADDYLMTYNLIDSPDGIILSARISWDRGDKIAAITKMEGIRPQVSPVRSPTYRAQSLPPRTRSNRRGTTLCDSTQCERPTQSSASS